MDNTGVGGVIVPSHEKYSDNPGRSLVVLVSFWDVCVRLCIFPGRRNLSYAGYPHSYTVNDSSESRIFFHIPLTVTHAVL